MVYYIDLNDKRCIVVKRLLEKRGYITKDYSFINECVAGDSVVFSPAKKLSTKDIELISGETNLYCGNVNSEVDELIKKKDINHINILKDEIFAVKNAILTAEGVLALLIENSPRSMYENNILILGGGRIANSLAVLFGKIGLNIAIVNFNPIKVPQANILAEKTYFKYAFEQDLQKYDVIINTIPAEVISNNIVSSISQGTLFIETASICCLNKEKANHFNYLLSPALPQRFAEETAGRLMFESIIGENRYV